MMDINILIKLRTQFDNKSSPAFVLYAEKHQNHMTHTIRRMDQGIQPDGYEYAVWEAWKDIPETDWRRTWQVEVLTQIDAVLESLREPYTFERQPTWEDYELILGAQPAYLTQVPIQALVAQARMEG